VIRFKIRILLLGILIFNLPLFSQSEFIKGVDVSTLLQIEDNGGVFKENGEIKDPIQIFKNHKINFVRLKLWHSPANDYNNLHYVLLAAEQIKSNGLKFLLDFHYSDTWADPAHQTKPSAWNTLPFESLKDSIYSYSKNVITTLKLNNLLPDIVQIGNEITCGMLWDDGRICDQFNTQQQWTNFGELIKEAIRGVNESLSSDDTVKIMIHIDRGGDNEGAQWFFDNLLSQDVSFDIIGISFYPWWHGTLTDLQNNLNDLAQRYGKEIILVETAYPWTLNWCDGTNNIVGDTSQLLPDYPATAEGQKSYLTDIINLVYSTFDNKGIGIFYWEPDWICAPTFGSPWENLALFDFNGELLSSIQAFDSTLTEIGLEELQIFDYKLYQNYPNPFNPVTSLQYAVGNRQFVSLIVYDVLGNEIAILVNEEKPAGTYEVKFNGTGFPSGIYFYQLKAVDPESSSGQGFIETKKMLLLK
jgi:arabinogalactan endo-1,4-beta-galactosidase